MKKSATVLTIILIVSALAVCVSAGSDPENPAEYPALVLGWQARETQPKTIDEFIPIFAAQLAIYNQIAPELWPDIAINNLTFVLDDVDTGRLWRIAPDGAVTALPESEAMEMGVERFEMAGVHDFFGDFYEYDANGNPFSYSLEGKDLSGGGIYFSVSEQELNNISRWGKWPHASSYDILRFAVHEAFHAFEQQKWQSLAFEDTANLATKDQFLEATQARIKRHLLLKQLMSAVNQPGEPRLILEALATYEDYKAQFPEDFRNALYWDRVEGTAQYLEDMYSLYAYFPDQIKGKEDADRALTQLAAYEVYRQSCGVVDEAYDIGAFSGVLLDRLGVEWKETLMNDPVLTPLEILSLFFEGTTLPPPRQPTQEENDEAAAKIQGKKLEIKELLEQSLVSYEKMLETAPEEEREWMEGYVEYLQKRILELSDWEG